MRDKNGNLTGDLIKPELTKQSRNATRNAKPSGISRPAEGRR